MGAQGNLVMRGYTRHSISSFICRRRRLRLPAHKAIACASSARHASRSLAICVKVGSWVGWVVFMSFFASASHVGAGRPCGRFVGRWNSASACLAGVFSGRRIKCPSQFSLLLLIVRLHGSEFVLL